MQGHSLSLGTGGETHDLMVNINENGRKEYEQPKMNVVLLEERDIIATSESLEGRGRDFDVDEDW